MLDFNMHALCFDIFRKAGIIMKKGISAVRKILSVTLASLMIISCAAAATPFLSELDFSASAAESDSSQYAADNPRIDVSFNNNWDFHLGDAAGAYSKAYTADSSEWDKVTLPHDFSITQDFTTSGTEGESGNKLGGTGWYRKWFTIPEAFAERELVLNFDGAYMHTYVYVNGTLVCENHYGYNAFSVDITDSVYKDGSTPNLIAVKVVNDIPSSRWYSGSGICRDVTISMINKTHVAQYGAVVTTPDVESGTGTAQTVVTVENESAASAKVYVKVQVLDSDGNTVSDAVVSDELSIAANASKDVTLSPVVSGFKLWSVESPNLYTMHVIVSSDAEGTQILDDYKTDFGFKYINWDASTGFSLNGENVKVKGACMHNDQGALGAVQEYDAIYRQVKILKEYGFNAIRTSHNVTSSVLLEVCNELGMLVMEEFFDGWYGAKNLNSNDFSTHFDTAISSDNNIVGKQTGDKWYQFVVRQTVKRDRNNPSIIIWSAGNELNHMNGYSDSTCATYAQDIHTIVQSLDSRPLTRGNNEQKLLTVENYMDVVGGNYYPYKWAVEISTTKPTILTETSSASSSRGFYGSTGVSGYEIGAYDAYAPSWGDSAEANLYYVQAYDKVSGEFIWTGFDYIGEPTPWNQTEGDANAQGEPVSSFFGVIDTAGFAKDMAYLYKAVWDDSGEHTLNLLPGTWNSSKLSSTSAVPVAVYTDAGYVELYMNNTLIGHASSELVTTSAGHTYRKWTTYSDASSCTASDFTASSGANTAAPVALYPQFKVKWASGTLSVKAWTDSSKSTEITDSAKGTKTVYSSQTIGSVKAEVWGTDGKDTFTGTADGKSYAYVEYTALDTDGNFMNDYNGTLTIEAANGVEIVGVDNGKPSDWSKFQESSVFTTDGKATVQMYNGKALVIVKTTDEVTSNGSVVTTCSDNVEVNGINITAVAETGEELYDEFEEVCPQSEISYNPTVYDKFDAIKETVGTLTYDGSSDSGSATTTVKYVYYTPTGTGSGNYIENGTYIIYNPSPTYSSNIPAAMTNTVSNTGMLACDTTVTVSGTELKSGSTNEYTFTNVSGNTYYIKDSSGKYLNMGTSDGSLTLSDTAQALSVYINSDKSVSIYRGSQFLDMYSGDTANGRPFSTWSNTTAGVSNNNKFNLYKKTATTDTGGSTTTDEVTYSKTDTISEGISYIIYNAANNAALSGTAGTNNISASTSVILNGTVLQSESSNEYQFESTGTNGQYYIKHVESGKYLSIPYPANRSNSSYLVLSDSATALYVTNDNGTIYIYNSGISGRQQTTYYTAVKYASSAFQGGDRQTSSSFSDDAYKMTIYSKNSSSTDGSTTTDDGTYSKYTPAATGTTANAIADNVYIIYCANPTSTVNGAAALTGETHVANASINSDNTVTVTDGVMQSSSANEYRFTWVEGNKYYIQNVETQKYLTISSNTIYLGDTASECYVYVKDDGTLLIYSRTKNPYVLSYSSSDSSSDYSFSVSYSHGAPDSLTYVYNDSWMTLYSKNGGSSTGGNSAKKALYNALKEGAEVLIDNYSGASVKAFVEAMESGLNVYNNADATDEEFTAAAKAITDAMAALTSEIVKLPSTLYKYGYSNANSAQDYTSGGKYMNAIAFEKMKALITSNDELMSQIKTVIGYDTGTWGDGYADTALEKAVNVYAKLYSISFAGKVVNGGTELGLTTETSTVSLDGSTYYPTMWNIWDKSGTTGSTDTADEGASIMGLFSSTLSTSGVPESHAGYTDALPYINTSATSGIRSNLSMSVNTTASNTKTVTITPLTGISVYIPDLFSKSDIETTTADTYAKYYWNTEFPFVLSTNRYGVNTYDYDSSDTSRMFRASYDDENHTAVSELVDVDSYSITRASKGTGTGFFPFNYQMSDTEIDEDGNYIGTTKTFSNENAIYHFGMSFSTEFSIPKGGVYAGNTPIKFEFSGDDDVLVYVDDTLVLDNGGIHGARSCSIDFTNKSITYQFAWDASTNTMLNSAEDTETVTYTYQADGDYSMYDYTGSDGETHSISADIKAALEKLNTITGDGNTHSFNFYFLERGSTDSNCKIKFNLQQRSSNVKLTDQTLVADYGYPISYNITENNTISAAAVNAGAKFDYIGVTKANEIVDNITDFSSATLPTGSTEFTDNSTDYTVDGFNYGSGTVNAKGDITYKLNDMNFTGSDFYYVAAKVTGDPTFSTESEYTQYEKVTFIPASTIYFEDNGLDSTAVSYTGDWTVEGTEMTSIKQAADLVGDSSANTYGYDPFYADKSYSRVYYDASSNTTNEITSTPAYYTTAGDGTYSSTPTYYNASGKVTTDVYYRYAIGGGYTATPTYYDADGNIVSTNNADNSLTPAYAYAYAYDWFNTEDNLTYSAGSAHKVTVSAADNPRKGGAWPTAEFTFTGTGFDVISLTDSTTGFIKVDVNSEDGTFSESYAVDTYYGYSYGQVYADANGNQTLEAEGNTQLYWSAKNDGSVSKTVTYYDADGNVTTENTGNIAYCESWLPVVSTQSLYQIPVIKILGLDYNKYTVTITPMYSTMFNHRADGVQSYDFYLDAIRIYDPALNDETVTKQYVSDQEGYPEYMEIKDMLLDAGKLTSDSTKDTQGIVFIDGIRNNDSRTDMSKYKDAGPNNELYLMGGTSTDSSGTDASNGQAVAFSIWATVIPQDIQIAAKAADGTPSLKLYTVSSDGTVSSVENKITSASDVYYSFNDMLSANGAQLTWSRVKGADDNYYYKTGTIVLQNSSLSEDDILSITNIKWTFDSDTGKGQFELSVEDASGAVTTTSDSAVQTASITPVLMSVNANTRSVALSAASVDGSDMSIIEDTENLEDDTVVEGENAVFTFDTYSAVEKIKVTDSIGTEISADSSYVEAVSDSGDTIKHWTVKLPAVVEGEHEYYVSGTDSDGFTTNSSTVTVKYTVNGVQTLVTKLQNFINKVVDFIKKLFSGLIK